MGSAWLTVFYQHIRHIPEYKGHGPAWLSVASFSSVPSVPAPIDLPRAISVDVYPLSRDYKPSGMVLEGDRVGVVSPVVQIVRELRRMSHVSLVQKASSECLRSVMVALRSRAHSYQPGALPVHGHIVDDRIEFGGDVEGRILREYYGTAIVAVLERLKYLRDIVLAGTVRDQSACLS